MKKKNFLLILLCVCITATFFVSCTPADDDNDGGWHIVYDDSTRELAKDSIPEDFDMEGQTVGIFYAQHIEDYAIGYEEEEDIVFSKIYERNQSVQKRLNCKLEFISSGTTQWNDVPDVLKQGIMANDGSFEVVFTTNNTVTQEKLFNYFQDVNNSEYIDLYERWWYYDAIEETSVDGYGMRLLYGDISIATLGNAGAIYYNKDLYEQYLSNGQGNEYLYQVVLDGKWTLEYFKELAKRSHIELGPDGNDGDIFAFMMIRFGEPLHYFPVSCDVQYYTRDDRGMPIIAYDRDKAVKVLELLYNMLYVDNSAFLVFPDMAGQEINYPNYFENGRLIFNLGTLSNVLSDSMREMQSDYGILPYPKYDEFQQEYISFMANGTVLTGIPVSVKEDRANGTVSAVVEALASESYRHVAVAFYETALKGAYSRDDTASQMMDIITGNHDTVSSVLTKNFVYEYSTSLSGIGTVINSLLQDKSVNFASYYEERIDAANVAMGELWKDYINNVI